MILTRGEAVADSAISADMLPKEIGEMLPNVVRPRTIRITS